MSPAPTTQPLSSTTGSDSAFEFLATSLRTCQTSHTRCHQLTFSTNSLPTRVIDVGESAGDLVSLHERGTLDQNTSYVALSHCWGGLQPLILSARTESTLRRGIDIGELPRTFRDAIFVCRRFGFRYLWIDSLCIMQDDTADWARESKCMRKVYSHAAFTIAATAAEDGSVGLFFYRPHPRLPPVQVEATWHADPLPAFEDRKTRFFPPSDTYFIGDFIGEVDDIQRSPLNNRAWVVQERCLSPRILHFGREILYWECHELFANELYPDGISIPIPAMNMFNLRHLKARTFERRISSFQEDRQLTADAVIPTDVDSGLGLYNDWLRLRLIYSLCSITREEDLLVALAGIADEVTHMFSLSASVSQDDLSTPHMTFIAGMWKPYLLQELSWSLMAHHPGGFNRPTKWRAPTWSWASSRCAIGGSKTLMALIMHSDSDPRQLSLGKDQPDILEVKRKLTASESAEIVEVHIETALSGEITAGFLRLGCRPFREKMRLSPKGTSGAFTHSLPAEATISNDTNWTGITLDSAKDGTEIDVTAVVLARFRTPEGESWVEGLVLQPSLQTPEMYERIGSFFFNDSEAPIAEGARIQKRHEEAEHQVITMI
ncbi:heterokaryon incompatibility protein-domain-containing protein [Boeremia exigua]|uniref:heterokaryon incompatibility protein-domain-containing protein n=1 Tax=Boeremia exigua TaxID=749465 RepID=UPI001E8CA651|nr:heterokaryon incompatibility protein-domain-containing protein [Boeremia exigua]KAH6632997.1 heterokaryon incompatibility protein-domain-containing protein [Boeremia exigua]